jgi:hypothetical protein
MNYQRIAPRDVFNEANFLKCIGQITHFIEAGTLKNVSFNHQLFNNDWVKFELDSDGELILKEHLFYRASDGEAINLSRNVNARGEWPILLVTEEWEYIDIFDSKGEISLEFEEWLGEGTSSEHNISQSIFGHATLMKCMGKLAFSVTENLFKHLSFDQDTYGQKGVEISLECGYFTPTRNLFTLKGEAIEFSRHSGASDTWLMTYWDKENSTYERVFDASAKLTDKFLHYIDEPKENWFLRQQ